MRGPRAVAEVPEQLPGDGGDRVGQEVDIATGVEPIHSEDQPERSHTLEVLERLAPVAELPGDVPGHGQVPGDQPTARTSSATPGSSSPSPRDTTRLGLGVAVTNPMTRHHAVTASAAATRQIESGGRAALVLGRGGSAVLQPGLRPAPTAQLERAVDDVRRLLSGEQVRTVNGTTARMA